MPPWRISTPARCVNTTVARFSELSTISSPDLETFRSSAFNIARPVQLLQDQFAGLPAVAKWFLKDATNRSILNIPYLHQYGATIVPLEITKSTNSTTDFARVERPLSDFLVYLQHQQDGIAGLHESSRDESMALRIYLAQCPLSTLPSRLLADLPTPRIVLEAGRGDVYDSSIWIGPAPTYTPLHKDPNPNLFVQLAGRKFVRIFEPDIGRELFAEAQRRLGKSASPSMRGEEMMKGEEKRVLEEMIWGDGSLEIAMRHIGYEAQVDPGDAIFIPKGWWHSIRGIGDGIVGSVNWWFR